MLTAAMYWCNECQKRLTIHTPRHELHLLAQNSGSHSTSWCLADGYRKEDQGDPTCLCGLERTLHCLFYNLQFQIKLNKNLLNLEQQI